MHDIRLELHYGYRPRVSIELHPEWRVQPTLQRGNIVRWSLYLPCVRAWIFR